MTDPLLDEHDVAELLKMSVHTLRQWRSVGRGPGYVKLGSRVRYRPDDINDWLKESRA